MGALANATSATLTLTARATKTGTLSDTATKTAEEQFDPVAGNNSASASVEVSPSADIAVTNSPSAAAINDGQEVTFTVTAKNNGPDPASGVALTDLLPAGLEYVSSSVSQGSYEKAKGVWTVGALANATSATLTLTARATKTGTLSDTATKTAEEQFDPVAGNNSASASVEVSPSVSPELPAPGPAAEAPRPVAPVANLSLGKSVSPAVVALPGEVTYSLTIANAGPDAARNVVVTDPLPAGETYVGDDGSCTVAGQTVSCGLGEMANQTTRTIHLRVRVAGSLGGPTLTNTARVTSATADSNPGREVAAAQLRADPARVTLRRRLRQRSVVPGGRLAYLLVVRSAGPSSAVGLRVCDKLPRQTTVVNRGGGQLAFGRICFALAQLAAGQRHAFSLVLRADSTASGWIVNRATVSGANFAPAHARAPARVRTPRLAPRRERGVTG